MPLSIDKPTMATALASLERNGFAVVENVLSAAEVHDVRTRLLAAAEKSEQRGVPTRGYAFDADSRNQRVFHLFNLDDIFIELIQHPLALRFVQHTLGESYLISNFSANITAPGSGAMQLHADQGYVLPPWPSQALACNVAWILDDFSEANGATRYVADSHLLGHGPEASVEYPTQQVEAPAGSIMVMDGRLWHQSGVNRSTDQYRAALFGYYVARWLRPQINWNAVLEPSIAAAAAPAFLDRLGYYNGNVESLIPNGDRAPIKIPQSISALEKDFPLDN